MKLSSVLMVTAALTLAVPVVTADVFATNAAYAKGKGGGGGGGGGSEKSKKEKPAASKSKSAASKSKAVKPAAAAPKPKNLNAQLGSLNSLKRNINGIMNSSDPKMASIKTIILASAALVGLEATEADAAAALATAQATYDTTVAGINAQITALEVPPAEGEPGYDPEATLAYETAVAGFKNEIVAAGIPLTAAQKTYDEAFAAAEEGRVAAGEDAFLQSIVDAYNATGQGGLTVETLTPEMIEFAKAELGFGDADGAIDDYIAAQAAAEAEAAAAQEAGDGEGESEGEEDPA